MKRKQSNMEPICRLDKEIKALQYAYKSLDANDEFLKFSDFPLSEKTQNGLRDSKYNIPTDIQMKVIVLSLQGKDVFGTAVTGSGKTLAFLIPVLENLYVKKWSRMDGIGAIVMSPTRELAYQTFQTLKKIGKYHDFSAGLIIGGKNLNFEKKRMDQCNILICTPGRLLQHMDENPHFNASTLEMFVLDEADRCLDMGFEATLNSILDNLPSERQTLLLSATRTNSVEDIARLNMREPAIVETNVKSQTNEKKADLMPEQLQQSYVVVSVEDKITMLWSFIKSHLKQKIIVFLTSCKQVKYIYEIFCKLRPGTSLLALYGSLHQDRRIAIYNDFMKKKNVVLFATDIASRGLDFPSVNWVVQLDCPEDVIQYIHRAGRSARNKTPGQSLLVLTPSEENAMIQDIQSKSIRISKIHIDPNKLFSPRVKIESYLAQNTELKSSAQRAFISYIKSIFLMRNKRIFNVESFDFDKFAKSLGLLITPRIRFLDRITKKLEKSGICYGKTDPIRHNSSKKDQYFDESNSDDDEFLKIKRIDHEIEGNVILQNQREELSMGSKRQKLFTKTRLAKKVIKKKLNLNQIRKFDDDGQIIPDTRLDMHAASEISEDLRNELENNATNGINFEVSKKLLSLEDKYDKERFRNLLKMQRKKQTRKIKPQDEIFISDSDDMQCDNSCGDYEELHDKVDCPSSAESNLVRASKFDQEVCANIPRISTKLSLNDAEVIAHQLLSNSV